MVFSSTRSDGLMLSDDQSLLDLDRCLSWLASSYWASDRAPEQVLRSFAGSRVFGVYDTGGRQLALTRAVTDGVSFCWIADVFVDEEARGRGIGSWLVGSVVERLKQEGVSRFLLGTRDAHRVYAKLGFESLRVPAVYMELDKRVTRPSIHDVDPSVLTADSAAGQTP